MRFLSHGNLLTTLGKAIQILLYNESVEGDNTATFTPSPWTTTTMEKKSNPTRLLNHVLGFGLDNLRYTKWLTGLEMSADEYESLKQSITNHTYTGRIVF